MSAPSTAPSHNVTSDSGPNLRTLRVRPFPHPAALGSLWAGRHLHKAAFRYWRQSAFPPCVYHRGTSAPSFAVSPRIRSQISQRSGPYHLSDALSASEKAQVIGKVSVFEEAMKGDKAALQEVIDGAAVLPSSLASMIDRYSPVPGEDGAIDELVANSAGFLRVVEQYEQVWNSLRARAVADFTGRITVPRSALRPVFLATKRASRSVSRRSRLRNARSGVCACARCTGQNPSATGLSVTSPRTRQWAYSS